MTKKKTGLKDIAREAGLAVPTVSLILNGRTNTFISNATRERVKAIALRLHYRPKFSHKLIHGVPTHTVAIIITERTHRSDEHIKSLILLLIERLEQAGFSSYISTQTGNPEDGVLDLINRGCDAFIVIGVLAYVEAFTRVCNENGVNYIGFNSTLDRNVISDTQAGVESILRYFIREKRNFKMILHPGKEAYAPNSRFQGLRRVFPDSGEKELWDRYVVPIMMSGDDAGSAFTAGYEATKALMTNNPDVNALFYFSDLYALGGAKWLAGNGYVIGKDVLVAGFNNTDAVKYHPFPISSGDQDIARIADMLSVHLFTEGPCTATVEPKVIFR